MKTNFLIACIIALFFSSNKALNAQIAWPYPITNNSNCDVIVCYEVADLNSGPPCEFCPVGGILISPGGTLWLNGSGCTALPIQDMHVVIVSVDGVAPSPACTAVGDPNTIINSCGGTNLTGITVGAPSNCSTINIQYNLSGTSIW